MAALTLLASLALHVGSAGFPDVYDELSGQYAGAAWEMTRSGDWLVPTLEGVPRLQKPPVVYWLTAGSFELLGRNDFAARLPTALATLGVIALTFAIGARLFGRRRGAVAAALLGAGLGTLLIGKIVAPEPLFTCAIGAALLAGVRAAETPGRAPVFARAAWLAAAVACLAKGLHGLLFPAAILSGVAALSPASRAGLRAFLSWRGVALFLAVVLPWHLLVELRFPGYLRDNLMNEQLGHVLGTQWPRTSKSTPVGLFWLQHAVWWFPAWLFVPAGLLAWSRRRWLAAHPAAPLPAVWLALVGVAVSAAGQRQDYYTFVAWPAFALLASRAFTRDTDRLRVAHALPALALALLGAAALAAAYAGVLAGPERTASFEARNSIAGALQGIGAAEWSRLAPLLVPTGLGLLAGGLAAFLLAARGRASAAWAPVTLGCVGLLGSATAGLQILSPAFAQKEIARAVNAALPAAPDAVVVFDGPSHRASSLVLYADAPVRWLHDPETELSVRSRGVGRDRFLDEATFARRWRDGDRLWLVTERPAHWTEALGALGSEETRSGTRVLLASPALRAALSARATPERGAP